MNIQFLEPARQEFIDAVAYYNQQRQCLGVEFADEVRLAIDRITEYRKPGRWLQRKRGVVARSGFLTESFIRSGAPLLS